MLTRCILQDYGWKAFNIQIHHVQPQLPQTAPTFKLEHNLAKAQSSLWTMTSNTASLHLQDLPEDVLRNILSMLTHHEVAMIRTVNKRFNTICISLLNKGFRSAKLYHTSLRRIIWEQNRFAKPEPLVHHKLVRDLDILRTIGTQIAILDETFLDYINNNLCCSVPGRIVDQILSMLRAIQAKRKSNHYKCKCECSRAYKTLQKFTNTSSKAIKHFNEKIAPTLKVQLSKLESTAVTED